MKKKLKQIASFIKKHIFEIILAVWLIVTIGVYIKSEEFIAVVWVINTGIVYIIWRVGKSIDDEHINHLRRLNDAIFKSADAFFEKNIELEKENEELKHQLKMSKMVPPKN